MDWVIRFTNQDGGVTFRHPAKNGLRPGETEEDYKNRLIADAKAERLTFNGDTPVILPPKATDEPEVVQASTKPADRSLRDAWRKVGGQVVEDRDRAKKTAEDRGLTVLPSDTLEDIRTKVVNDRAAKEKRR